MSRRPRKRSAPRSARGGRSSGKATAAKQRATAPATATPQDEAAEVRRRRRAAARPTGRQPPDAPWGRFPLVEVCVLLALAIGVLGVILGGERGTILLITAAALGSLAGLELSLREHLAGFRSHTTLLAASVAVLASAITFFGGAPQEFVLVAAVVAFGVAWWLLRELFKRRSGGLGFR